MKATASDSETAQPPTVPPTMALVLGLGGDEIEFEVGIATSAGLVDEIRVAGVGEPADAVDGAGVRDLLMFLK